MCFRSCTASLTSLQNQHLSDESMFQAICCVDAMVSLNPKLTRNIDTTKHYEIRWCQSFSFTHDWDIQLDLQELMWAYINVRLLLRFENIWKKLIWTELSLSVHIKTNKNTQRWRKYVRRTFLGQNAGQLTIDTFLSRQYDSTCLPFFIQHIHVGIHQPKPHTGGWRRRSSSCRPAGCTGSGRSARCFDHTECLSLGRKALNHWAASCPVPNCRRTLCPAWRKAAASS